MAIENGERILKMAKEIVDDLTETNDKLLRICRMLEREVLHYHWVGFYLTDPDERQMLVLGPYVGEKTEHTRIPFGSGICGQAADTGKVFLIQDVSLEDNYLSCSPDVRSEIVIPIRANGEIMGELDIDSHDHAPFDKQDREILERICEMVSTLIETPEESSR